MRNKPKNDLSGLKRTFLWVAAAFVAMVFAYLVITRRQDEPDGMVVIEPASESMLFPESERISVKGSPVAIASDGIMFEVDGRKVLVRSDGSVWTVNEDGSMERADAALTAKALAKAKEFAGSNEDVRTALDGGGVDESLDLTELSGAEIASLADAVGLDAAGLAKAAEEAKAKGEKLTLGEVIERRKEAEKARRRAAEATKEELGELIEVAGIDGVSADEFYEAVQSSEEYKDNPAKLSADIIRYGTDYVLDKLGLDPGRGTDGADGSNGRDGRNGRDGDIRVAAEAQRYSSPNGPNGAQSALNDYLSGKIDSLEGLANPPSDYEKQNGQAAKAGFAASHRTGTKVVSRAVRSDMLTTGTIISATLVTDVNTDLPGTAIAIVNQNVLDSFTMDNVLIPKGSRLIGTYDSSVSYGQTRVLMAWNKVVMANGTIADLNGYGSVDNGGAGLSGNVDNHILPIVGGTALSTLMGYANGRLQDITASEAVKALITNSASSIVKVEDKLLGKIIDRQPTITIPKGTSFSVLVNDDVQLPPFRP